MKKINILLVIALSLFFINKASSQSMNPKMTFNNTKFDFGKIDEKGGKVTHKYIFTNTGAESILIKSVKPSCGCTTSEWTRKPVAPGATGYIVATYNPFKRPGRFNKSIRIVSNAENSPVVLYLTGEVIKKKEKLEEVYRYSMGDIRLTTKNIHFGEIKKIENSSKPKANFSISGMLSNFKEKTKYSRVIGIINTGKENVNISHRINKSDKHIDIQIVPETLKPNEKGNIFVTYDPSKVRGWGYVRSNVYLTMNKKNRGNNRLYISANIVESFSKEQIANPPKMEFIDPMSFDFGTVNQKDVVEHVYRFKNSGKSDLIIRKTKASCGCTAIAPKDKVIKPGQESSIKAVFNTRGKRNRQTKTITIITNEPGKTKGSPNSRVILKLVGFVKVPK